MIRRLSLPVTAIKPGYTAVVIGSGYGGAIAASRIARAGQSVCVLERGRERRPGEYPVTTHDALTEIQIDAPEGHIGDVGAMFDFRVNADVTTLVGCGLGGTSLINANVTLAPNMDVFADGRWPAALHADADGAFARGFVQAKAMLAPSLYPDAASVAKIAAFDWSAEHMRVAAVRVPLAVTFEPGPNPAGFHQAECTSCGDCVSGCNVGAKNTVLMNYLPDAEAHGAEIFTEVSARWIERRADDGWNVYYDILDVGRERFDAPACVVRADVVIVAAGALGSTEILLRSKDHGLPMSARVGQGFTGNGDLLGFAYNCDRLIDGVGVGGEPPGSAAPVGPTITTGITFPDTSEGAPPGATILLQEGAIPGPIGAFMPLLLKESALLGSTNTAPDRLLEQLAFEAESLLLGARRGAVIRTQTYLAMGDDTRAADGSFSPGTMKLEAGRLRIDWPGVGGRPLFGTEAARMASATAALRGVAVENPFYSKLLGRSALTVHPLGGCGMAESAELGGVDHRGKLFSASAGDAVHEGLYVCDGAVLPAPLGVNPMLTISALAERCMEMLIHERGWAVLEGAPAAIAKAPPAEPAVGVAGIRFSERMKGWFSAPTDGLATPTIPDFERAAAASRAPAAELTFTLTIESDDLDAMIASPAHASQMAGTLAAPGLAPGPLTVVDGVFNLFERDPSAADVRLMRYRGRLVGAAGERFYFSGVKIIREHPFWDVWHDNTTLYLSIYAGDDARGREIGRGIVTVGAADFLRQLGTIDATNTADVDARLAATARFGLYFAGVLYTYFGGAAAPLGLVDTGARPRKRRPLRAPPPTLHPFTAGDGAELLLTRHEGGDHGPVLLIHGLGVSSRIFTVDTIETNLLEALVSAGHDVWLLDYRASTLIPASRKPYTADDVAIHDHPAAVAKVLELSGATSLQVVAHCYGALTFTMAMLSGEVKGVRSLVLSQIAGHVVAAPLLRAKSELRAPGVLEAIGVETLTAVAAKGESWAARLYDRALKLYPHAESEDCTSAVCHRIRFMYAPLYEHAKLNAATHDTLYELFGEASTEPFVGLAEMVRKERAVNTQGEDVYLPHLERLAIPVRFIHGEKNACFLPESTERTFDALVERNGEVLYSRQIIPGYGHIDCIFGERAAADVYPYILQHLART